MDKGESTWGAAGSLSASYRSVALPVYQWSAEFQLERVFMLSHTVGTHDTRCSAYCYNTWKKNAKARHYEQTVYHWHHRVAGMGGLGPSTAKADVWPGNEKRIRCHRAVLTYAAGTTLWVELTTVNRQKGIRVQARSPRSAFQSITKNNQYGYWKEIGDFFFFSPC